MKRKTQDKRDQKSSWIQFHMTGYQKSDKFNSLLVKKPSYQTVYFFFLIYILKHQSDYDQGGQKSGWPQQIQILVSDRDHTIRASVSIHFYLFLRFQVRFFGETAPCIVIIGVVFQPTFYDEKKKLSALNKNAHFHSGVQTSALVRAVPPPSSGPTKKVNASRRPSLAPFPH